MTLRFIFHTLAIQLYRERSCDIINKIGNSCFDNFLILSVIGKGGNAYINGTMAKIDIEVSITLTEVFCELSLFYRRQMLEY
jgi:hypothetical protein